MGLDNFKSEDTTDETSDTDKEEQTGNKRTSEMFTRDEFEDVLEDTEYDWSRMRYDWAREWIYEAESENGNFIMRVYSSVDRRNNKSREKDSDAIRLTVIDAESERPVMKEKRTNRIKTWPKNLKKKIHNVKNRKDEITICSECGSLMVVRSNKETGEKFLGCTNYPDCQNVEQLE